MYTYRTKGTCSKEIHFDVKNNKLTDVKFVGGCNGNLRGIGVLVENMDLDEVIEKLQDVRCGDKNTSCPAELAKAVKEYKENQIVKKN